MSLQQNCIFIHVPKTAGTAIKKILKQQIYNCKNLNNKQHNTLTTTKYIYCPNYKYRSKVIDDICNDVDIERYYTFCFIRNPYDRVVSSWKFGSWNAKWTCSFPTFCRLLECIDISPDKSYYDSSYPKDIERYYVKREGKSSRIESREIVAGLINHVGEQYSLVHGNRVVANYVGRFENIQEDFDIVCSNIGIEQQKLPHVNKTNHKHYTEYYDDKTYQIITKKYSKDINYFNYKF